MNAYRSPRFAQSAQAYASIGLETQVMSASPEQLIVLLFDGARAAVAKAGLHLQHGRVAQRGEAISRAIAIIDTGLKASLDMQAGGELASNLAATYDAIMHNLLLANLHADASRLELAASLLAQIGDAWRQATMAQAGAPEGAPAALAT